MNDFIFFFITNILKYYYNSHIFRKDETFTPTLSGIQSARNIAKSYGFAASGFLRDAVQRAKTAVSLKYFYLTILI